MPVRFEDDPLAARSRRGDAARTTNTVPPAGQARPRKRRPRRRGGVMTFLVTLAAVALLAVTVIAALKVRDAAVAQQPHADASGSSSAASAKVAGDLARGSASAEGAGREALHGVPVGYPDTPDGAVSAALNYVAAGTDVVILNEQKRAALNARVCGEGPCFTDADAAALAKDAGTDSSGKAVNRDTGRTEPGRVAIAKGYPRYSAYRVVDHTRPDAAGRTPDTYVIRVVMPSVRGTMPDGGSDASAIKTVWLSRIVAVTRSRDDWKLRWQQPDHAPEFEDPNLVNQTFEERARVLGPGWNVPADGSQDALPGTVNTK